MFRGSHDKWFDSAWLWFGFGFGEAWGRMLRFSTQPLCSVTGAIAVVNRAILGCLEIQQQRQ